MSLPNVPATHEPTQPADVKDTATSAAATAVSITYPAPAAGQCNVISGVVFSYSASVAAGAGITITDGVIGLVLTLDASAAGVNPVVLFVPPRRFTPGASVTITLNSAGGTVVGKLNVLGHWIETATP